MPFTVQPSGDVLIVKVHARRLDTSLAPEFKAKLVHLVHSGQERIVMDMAALECIDSSGLGALIAGLKALHQHSFDALILDCALRYHAPSAESVATHPCR